MRTGEPRPTIGTACLFLLLVSMIGIMSHGPELLPSPVEDISRIRWDQATFLGRLNHFSRITDPRLLLKSRRDVETAQHLYHQAKWGSGHALREVPNSLSSSEHTQGGSCSTWYHPDTTLHCPDSLPFSSSPRHRPNHAPTG